MKLFRTLAPVVVLALLFAGCSNPTQTPKKSDAKALTSFTFEATKNPGVLTKDYAATYNDNNGKWEVGPLPAGTNVKALVATFAISAKASAAVGSTAQVSGTTANDFSSEVKYTITAEDGSTASYTVAVSVTVAATGKDMSAYSLMIGSDLKAATINGTAISLIVAHGTDVTALKATFIVSSAKATVKVGATTQVSAETANDFTNPVSYVVTAEDQSTQTYTVTVTALPEEKLMFTEYFEGLSNNKYLEITNTGTTDIDLSAYTITEVYVGSDNTADSTKNNVKTLSGTLTAGKSVVYANSSYATATLTVANAMSTTASNGSSWLEKVADSSNITYFNGNDPLVLSHSGVAVDRIGPSDSVFDGADRLLVRKAGVSPVATYDATQWKSFAFGTANLAGDDWSAGNYASADTGSKMRLFAINGVRGTITTGSGTGTIAVSLPTGTDVTALAPSFITDAASVTVASAEQTSASSTQNFTSPVSYVVSTGSSSTTYTVTVTLETPTTYTSTNYNFDGGLQALRTTIGSSATAVTLSATVTGIVTSIPATNKFYIQDQNCGLCFFMTGASANIKVGDKVSIPVTSGMFYKGYLYEVTAFTVPSNSNGGIISSGNSIYYMTADATNGWSGEILNRLFYVGNVAFDATADRAQTGKLNSNTGMITRCPTSTITFLPAVGVKKDFYGVVEPYLATGTTYQMILYKADQIRDVQ
jgi:hypothetical protein